MVKVYLMINCFLLECMQKINWKTMFSNVPEQFHDWIHASMGYISFHAWHVREFNFHMLNGYSRRKNRVGHVSGDLYKHHTWMHVQSTGMLNVNCDCFLLKCECWELIWKPYYALPDIIQLNFMESIHAIYISIYDIDFSHSGWML